MLNLGRAVENLQQPAGSTFTIPRKLKVRLVFHTFSTDSWYRVEKSRVELCPSSDGCFSCGVSGRKHRGCKNTLRTCPCSWCPVLISHLRRQERIDANPSWGYSGDVKTDPEKAEMVGAYLGKILTQHRNMLKTTVIPFLS